MAALDAIVASGEVLLERLLAWDVQTWLNTVLIAFVVYIVLQKRRPPKRKHAEDMARAVGLEIESPLTTAEVDRLVAEWRPAPLLSEPDPHTAVEMELAAKSTVLVVGGGGRHIDVVPLRATPTSTVAEAEQRVVAECDINVVGVLGDGTVATSVDDVSGTATYKKPSGTITATNFSTFDYLALAGSADTVATAQATVAKYGCGSCGPRGFYGTIDKHLELERRLAAWYGTESAIVYSSQFATVSSGIPAFSKRGDILVVDRGCSFAVHNGAHLSRAIVEYFTHNSMESLESILRARHRADKSARPRPQLTRRFVVVEGLYASSGRLAPLPQIVRLCEEYRYRLVIDDSYATGILGANGKGSLEHWGLPQDVATLYFGSLGNAIGSIGGFCVGRQTVTLHQRLNGAGYCFSASLPPFQVAAATTAINIIESPKGAALRSRLAKLAALATAEMRRRFAAVDFRASSAAGAAAASDVVSVIGIQLDELSTESFSPIKNVRLVLREPLSVDGDAAGGGGGGDATVAARRRAFVERCLHRLCDLALTERHVFVSRARHSHLELVHSYGEATLPAVRVLLNAALTDDDVRTMIAAVAELAPVAVQQITEEVV